MLNISNLKVYYGHSQALFGVTLNIEDKGIVVLLGANGSGKSTILRTISGILKPKVGSINYKNTNITSISPHKIVRLGISHAPEGRELFVNMTVRENLLAGQYHINDNKRRKTDLERVINWFPILGERLYQQAGTLSGGEQQMLSISRAYLTRPTLLMLDEPSLGLSPIYVKKIFDAILQINNETGLTILLAEQNAMTALSISNYGYVLELGKISTEGPSEELLKDKKIAESYLGSV